MRRISTLWNTTSHLYFSPSRLRRAGLYFGCHPSDVLAPSDGLYLSQANDVPACIPVGVEDAPALMAGEAVSPSVAVRSGQG